MNRKAAFKTLFVTTSLSLAGLTYAQTQRPHGPPPEALQACAGQPVNAACGFQSPHGYLQGQCVQTPHGQTACLPEGHQSRMRGHDRQQRGQGQNRQRGQGAQPGGGRTHTVTQSTGQLTLVAANQNSPAPGQVSINAQNGQRIIQSNGISVHRTGSFPNSGNPHTISQQNHQFRIALNPQTNNQVTPLGRGQFGVGVNGVPFEPGAAETYHTDRSWHYEALSDAVPLGFDTNHAHVQPSGKYHYHGLPTGLMQRLGVNASKHSPLIGWAADGFPIYTLYGYQNGQDTQSGITQHTSSYRLKQGQRPGGDQPSGTYDGTFVKDYQYVMGAGTLDECNGRFVKTPEFPQGTYAYFLTQRFPVIPRCFKGTPSQDFEVRIPGMRRN